MTLSPEAVQKLLRVKEQILAESNLYTQDVYALPTSCGTACCIAGWMMRNELTAEQWYAAINTGRLLEFGTQASQLLGSSRFVSSLFAMADDWPAPFAIRYENACSPKERAAVGAARIDAFIAEHTEAR